MNIEHDDLLCRAPCDEEILQRYGVALPPCDLDMSIVTGYIAMEAEHERLRRKLASSEHRAWALEQLCLKQRRARKNLEGRFGL